MERSNLFFKFWIIQFSKFEVTNTEKKLRSNKKQMIYLTIDIS
uniref:Uncharacterized protein n=1 Tax=Palmaria decipiens TaxID=187399 RepID=A0A6C0W4G4_PALDE|nr:hypothetical protein [Palmaria decipiens]QIC19596.1 hypothetical protein [Palmaria decipiens]